MGFKWRAKGILAKIETSYGTDATPVPATNSLLPIDVSITPLDGESIKRAIELPYLGNQGEILVKTHVSLGFKAEIAGSGTAGTAPAYGALLRGCGFAETLTPGSKAEYAPVTLNQESLSLYTYLANALHKAIGGRGNVGVNLSANTLPTWDFTFKGLFVPVTAAAAPTLVTTAWKTPVTANKNNTTISLQGYSAIVDGFSLNMGNDIQGRFLIGQEEISLVDRDVTGEITIEAPDPATKNFFDAATNRTVGAIAVAHGTVAGNIVQVDAPSVEIGRPNYDNSQGVAMLKIPLILKPSVGNDEVKLTVK